MNAHDYSNDYVMVKFLTQMAPEKYVWPEVDDIDIFSRYMYMYTDILNKPQMHRRDTH